TCRPASTSPYLVTSKEGRWKERSGRSCEQQQFSFGGFHRCRSGCDLLVRESDDSSGTNGERNHPGSHPGSTRRCHWQGECLGAEFGYRSGPYSKLGGQRHLSHLQCSGRV